MIRTTTIKQQIMALLGLTEADYAKCIEYFGYQYAWHYTQHSRGTVEYYTKAEAYWRWFHGQQYLRDETFLAEMQCYENTGSEQSLYDLWFEHNTPDQITARPTKKVLDAAYQLMLEDVRKENEKKQQVFNHNSK